MALDYLIWKWKQPPGISRGLCSLLLSEMMETPEVDDLDLTHFERALSAAFPGWDDPSSEPPFISTHYSVAVHLSVSFSASPSVVAWFRSYAEANGLEFFDPQAETVSASDRRAFRERQQSLRRALAAERDEEHFTETASRAASGDLKALVELGNCYSFGEGAPRDLESAFSCYLQAAEKGSSEGMFNLAACYRTGEGVARDVAAALDWYHRALEGDPLFASFAIAEMFERGESGEPDLEAAERYYRIALENGHQDAPKALRRIGAMPPL